MVLRTCNAAPSGARSGAGGGGSIHNQLYNWLCIYYSVLPGIVNRGQAALGNFFAPAHPEGATAFPCHPTPPVPGILPASFRACHPARLPVFVILGVLLSLSSRQFPCLCHPEPPQPCHPERSEGSSLIPLQARRGNRRRGGKILRRCAPQDDRGETDAPRADKRGGRHPLRRQKARLSPLEKTKGETVAPREDKGRDCRPPRRQKGRQAPLEKTKGETVAPREDKRRGRHPLRRQRARLTPFERTKGKSRPGLGVETGRLGKTGNGCAIRPSGTPDRPPWASGPGR